MFVSTINFFLETKIVFMCRLPEPYIETQPKIFIPKYSIKESSFVNGSEVKDESTLDNMLGMTFFSLGFSVNFEDTNEQPDLNNSCLYDIDKTKITCKRFYKKVENIKKGTEFYKPLNIILPYNLIEIHSFSINIEKKLLKGGVLDLKNNTLSVWLSMDYNEPIVEEIQLKKAIANLKNIFQIRPFNDPQHFAFQFCVEFSISSMFMNIGVEPKLVYTHMFEIFFDDINLSVELNEVNPINYYLN